MRKLLFALSLSGSLYAQTATFPTAVVTEAQLMRAVNSISTTLLSAQGASDTVLVVKDATGIVPNMLLSVGTTKPEIEVVCSVVGSTIHLGQAGVCDNINGRGFDGTIAAAHAINSPVVGSDVAWLKNKPNAELMAIETALGPNLANVRTAIQDQNVRTVTDYAFAAQTPGGTLTGGGFLQSITLAQVPAGMNGTDTFHSVWLTAGAGGTAEACLIVGGTAVAGASSGTINCAPAHAHGAGYQVQPVNGGLAEALQAASTAGGGVVMIPPATTIAIHAMSPVPSNVKLRGAGPSSVLQVATWATTNNDPAWDRPLATGIGDSPTAMSFALAAENASMENFTLDGNGAGTAQFSYTDLASTNCLSSTPTVSSTSHTFVAADVNKGLIVTAGTNWIAQTYYITSVGSGNAVLNAACGSANSVSGGSYGVHVSGTPINAPGVSHTLIDGVIIKNFNLFQAAAVWMTYTSDYPYATNNTITNVQYSGPGGKPGTCLGGIFTQLLNTLMAHNDVKGLCDEGYILSGANTSGSRVTDNTFLGDNPTSGTQPVAFHCEGCWNSLFDGNVVKGYTASAFNLGNNGNGVSKGVTIANNIIKASEAGGTPDQGIGCSGGTVYYTDLTSSNGTNPTPTVRSASYQFTSADVNKTLIVFTSTGWIPASYLITSTSGGGAVLNAPVGSSASISGGPFSLPSSLHDVTITANYMSAGMNGFWPTYCDNFTFQGNTITGLTSGAIVISSVATNGIMSGNMLRNNAHSYSASGSVLHANQGFVLGPNKTDDATDGMVIAGTGSTASTVVVAGAVTPPSQVFFLDGSAGPVTTINALHSLVQGWTSLTIIPTTITEFRTGGNIQNNVTSKAYVPCVAVTNGLSNGDSWYVLCTPANPVTLSTLTITGNAITIPAPNRVVYVTGAGPIKTINYSTTAAPVAGDTLTIISANALVFASGGAAPAILTNVAATPYAPCLMTYDGNAWVAACGGSSRAIGAAVTVTSGFGTNPSVAGGDTAFRVTLGTPVGTSGVIALKQTWATAPIFACNNETTTTSGVAATPTTSQVTLSTSFGTWTAGDKISCVAIGY